MNLKEVMEEIHATAKEKGWWEENNQGHYATPVERIAMIGCEVSEAIEAEAREHLGEHTLEEVADVVIRSLDFAAGCYSIEEFLAVLQKKMAKNKKRSHRHGGKLL